MVKIRIDKPYKYIANGLKTILPGEYTSDELGQHATFIVSGGYGVELEVIPALEDELIPDEIAEANEILDSEDDELTRDEIKALLDDAGIKYDGRASTEKLLSLLAEGE